VELEAKDNIGWRPMHYAFCGGYVEIVKLLLDKVDLEAKDNDGWRPIHHACYRGYVEIVKLFLDKVDFEAKDNLGRRPIHCACYKSHVEIVKLLLNKVDLEAEDINGCRPIHHACCISSVENVKLLVDGFISDKIYAIIPKVKLNCRNKQNKTPLELTVNSYIREFLKMKLEAVNRTLFVKINQNYTDILINI
jgi:ankyrin repeat protein